MIPLCMILQYFMNKTKRNPSGPGALSIATDLIVCMISSSFICSINAARSWSDNILTVEGRVDWHPPTLLVHLGLKTRKTFLLMAWVSLVTIPLPSFKRQILFLCFQTMVDWWKKFGVVVPFSYPHGPWFCFQKISCWCASVWWLDSCSWSAVIYPSDRPLCLSYFSWTLRVEASTSSILLKMFSENSWFHLRRLLFMNSNLWVTRYVASPHTCLLRASRTTFQDCG